MYTAHDHVVEVGGTEVVHAITFTCVDTVLCVVPGWARGSRYDEYSC